MIIVTGVYCVFLLLPYSPLCTGLLQAPMQGNLAARSNRLAQQPKPSTVLPSVLPGGFSNPSWSPGSSPFGTLSSQPTSSLQHQRQQPQAPRISGGLGHSSAVSQVCG